MPSFCNRYTIVYVSQISRIYLELDVQYFSLVQYFNLNFHHCLTMNSIVLHVHRAKHKHHAYPIDRLNICSRRN